MYAYRIHAYRKHTTCDVILSWGHNSFLVDRWHPFLTSLFEIVHWHFEMPTIYLETGYFGIQSKYAPVQNANHRSNLQLCLHEHGAYPKGLTGRGDRA